MGYEDLKVLDDLRKSGAITEEEYQQQKQRIFDGAVQPQPQPKPTAAAQGQPYGGQPGQQYGGGQPGQQYQSGQQYQQAQAYTYPHQQPRSTALFGMSENNYLVLMHISQFAGFIIPFVGYIAPVVMWLLNKDASARVDATGKRILNFILSFLIYTVVSGILTLILLGFLLLAILGVMWLVFIIVAAVKASSGEDWDYPLAIKFFR
jgi:uncharacterized Tic20 family protein